MKMKTFFWTSVVWMLALGAFWYAGEYSLEGRDLWIQIMPNAVKSGISQNFVLEDVVQAESGELIETSTQNSDALSGESADSELLTWDVLSGEVEVMTGDSQLTGVSDQEAEFIVTVVGDEADVAKTQTWSTTNATSQKEIEALQSRVEALEYHLLMLMQSLKQPSVQPVGLGMKYPVWNFTLQN